MSSEDAYESALVAELAKKSGLLWVCYGAPEQAHPVWHTVVDGAVCVVAGGEEQPLPDIAEQQEVTLVLRSKATRYRIAETRATVELVEPPSEHWTPVVTALVAGRLNLLDRDRAPERWAAGSTVVRLIPTTVLAAPGRLPDTDHRATPVDSPATTTSSRTPWVAHRRQRVRPPLS